MRRVFAFIAAIAFAAPSIAAPATWTVDPAKSSLSFAVSVNGQTVTGKLASFAAVIAFDPAGLAQSSAKVTIPMAGAKTDDATRDAMLPRPDWFNVAGFPQAVFRTTAFVAKGGNAYEATGKLTLKGITKDVTLPFTLSIAGDTAVMKGETVLKRLDFGVGTIKEFAGETPVALSVKVMVNVTAKRAK